MQPRPLLADFVLGFELPHRTVERRWIHAHRAAHLANGHAWLRVDALEHLLAPLSGLGEHAARRVIAHVEAQALRKLAQLAVLLDQRLELPDAYGEISLKPAKVA